jgi:hypothetical protein
MECYLHTASTQVSTNLHENLKMTMQCGVLCSLSTILEQPVRSVLLIYTHTKIDKIWPNTNIIGMDKMDLYKAKVLKTYCRQGVLFFLQIL